MIVLLVILGLVILLVLIGIGYQNKFVKLQERVKNSWSQIDVQLQKRFDLIPNLVEVVKGYATHEKETLERVVAARTHYTTAGTVDEKIKASGELGSVLSRLMMVSESYPELKANTNFLDLQNQLKDIENKKLFYDSKTILQEIVQGEEPLFKVESEVREAPKVKF